VMYTSHSVMEGKRHNNPLNPHCSQKVLDTAVACQPLVQVTAITTGHPSCHAANHKCQSTEGIPARYPVVLRDCMPLNYLHVSTVPNTLKTRTPRHHWTQTVGTQMNSGQQLQRDS